MSSSAPPPTVRSVRRAVRSVPVPTRGGPRGLGAFTRSRGGVVVLGAGLLVSLLAAGRTAWLARARRRFAGLRGPRFDQAVEGPAVRLDRAARSTDAATVAAATAGQGDTAPAGGPIVDATVIEGERSFATERAPGAITDATVVDDEPGATP